MKRWVTEFVVSWVGGLTVIGFLLFLVLGTIGGAGAGLSAGTDAGVSAEAGMIFGAVAGFFFAALWGTFIFGFLFLIIQNNQTLKDIRALLQTKE